MPLRTSFLKGDNDLLAHGRADLGLEVEGDEVVDVDAETVCALELGGRVAVVARQEHDAGHDALGHAHLDGGGVLAGGHLDQVAGDDAECTPIALDGLYGTVSHAYSISVGGSTYYGFAARPLGYGNMPMLLYYVLDENGAIVSMTADELILMGDYFNAYELNESDYKAGFAGITGDSWNGDQALISGATISSEAVSAATADVFLAFGAIDQNGGEG